MFWAKLMFAINLSIGKSIVLGTVWLLGLAPAAVLWRGAPPFLTTKLRTLFLRLCLIIVGIMLLNLKQTADLAYISTGVLELYSTTKLLYSLPLTLQYSTDPTSTAFFTVTVLIGAIAIFYSLLYMSGEAGQIRFINYLVAFLISMLFFLLSSNLVSIFLGWELIGLFSFLLIGFWTTKTTSTKAALKALAYNQLSDACLLGFIIYHTVHMSTLNLCATIPTTTTPTTTTAAALLAVCVCCKSAQFPLFFWLPDSMEAPIPASALIHSATLVSAGIFLIIKLRTITNFPVLTPILQLAAGITIVIGGLATTVNFDLKKILAFSTISNCGLTMLLVASEDYSLGFMYFAVHGIAKAGSFFLIGLCVLELGHRQDWRSGVITAGVKNPLLLYSLSLLTVLGAIPTTLMAGIKAGAAGAASPHDAPHLTSMVLIGGVTSIIYSVKIIGALVTSQPTKQPHTSAPSKRIFTLLHLVALWSVAAGTALNLTYTNLALNYPTYGALTSPTPTLYQHLYNGGLYAASLAILYHARTPAIIKHIIFITFVGTLTNLAYSII